MKGGVALSQGNPSCLRFSLEESVWFQRGQEVLDLISISLDPDILIKETEQYVTIQGALELSGEYKRNELEAQDEEEMFAIPKFIQVVEEREEGICEFHHFFPVDITIPKNRIDQIENIDVKVESFDYVFPERSCMKLTANLMITGLYGEGQYTPAYEYEEEYEEIRVDEIEEEEKEEFVEDGMVEIPLDDRMKVSKEIGVDKAEQEKNEEVEEVYLPFKAEARKQPEHQADKMAKQQLAQSEEKEAVHEIEKATISNIEKEEVNRVEEAPVLMRKEESSSSIDVFKMPKVEESSIPEAKVSEEVEIKVESPNIAMTEEFFESEVESSSQEVKQKKKTKKKKKSMTLTEFFARKEEHGVAKLKVCIVQNGDTVETIAERYDISVLQLRKVNNLEINHEIEEGQVLYIPVAVAR